MLNMQQLPLSYDNIYTQYYQFITYYRMHYSRGILTCIVSPQLCTCTSVFYIFVHTYIGRSPDHPN